MGERRSYLLSQAVHCSNRVSITFSFLGFVTALLIKGIVVIQDRLWARHEIIPYLTVLGLSSKFTELLNIRFLQFVKSYGQFALSLQKKTAAWLVYSSRPVPPGINIEEVVNPNASYILSNSKEVVRCVREARNITRVERIVEQGDSAQWINWSGDRHPSSSIVLLPTFLTSYTTY